MTERAGDRALGGRYRVGRLLSAGGMGTVWAAEDVVLGRPVAVKLLGVSLAGDDRAAERLRREARLVARLVHPNIARVLDLGEEDGRPYLVMELLEGDSLAARIGRDGPMAPAEAARIAAAVADALEVAHRARVVHRDVKPGNVFLTTGGEVKVLDFGIAKCAQEAALTTGDLFGTVAYLAPERALGQQATPASDVYALGVLLYELLTGRRPFNGSDVAVAMAHVNAKAPPLRQAAPWVPPALAVACDRALAKDPAARPPSAAAFARLLSPTPVATPRTPTTQSPQTRRLDRPSSPLPVPVPVPVAVVDPTRRLPARGPGRRVRRRRWAVALLLVAAVLAALPALGGIPIVDRGSPAGPTAVASTPDPGASARPGPDAPLGADPGAAAGDPPGDAVGASGDGAAPDEDEHDRDDGSGGSGGGSGRSGGGDSDSGDSSGPG